MASVFSVLRTCGLIVHLILQTYAVEDHGPAPWIVSTKVEDKNCVEKNCKYLLNVRGGEFLGHYSWRLSPVEAFRGGNCDVISPNYELKEIYTDQWVTKIEVVVPNKEGKIFFCLHYSEKKNAPFGGKWVHQGEDLFLDPKNDVVSQTRGKQQMQASQDTQTLTPQWADLSHDIDVNQLPGVARPSRHERSDIEVLIKDKYVPLNDITDDNVQRNNIFEANHVDSNKDVKAVDVNKQNYKGKVKDDSFNIDGKEAFESWNVKANVLNRRKRSIVNVEFLDDTNVDGIENVKEYSGKYPNRDTVDNYNVKSVDFIEKSIEKRQVVKDVVLKSNIDIEDMPRMERKQNTTDVLITSQDIVKAREHLVNAIKPINVAENHEDALIKIRKQRQAVADDFTSVKGDPFFVRIEGLRVEDSEKEPKIVEDSIPSVLADSGVTLRLFGEGLTTRTMIAFTYDAQKYGEPCKFLIKGEYLVKPDSITPKSALFDIVAPHPMLGSKLYICAKNLKAGVVDPFKDEDKYMHQGTEPFKMLATHNKLLPLWVSLILILVCLMFSALFSGLNLGLMSLDRTELKIISNTGTEQERKYARAIMPVRDHGNYLLCSILLGNVAVNSTFTILLDELTSGLFAVIFSTLSIVLLGEITPQAICSRHGLMVGAKSIMVTKAVMAITAPLAFPVSKLLDYFLGEEIGSVYNRERLKELVKVTTDVNDLDKDEVNIISGALELRKKTVSDVMTKLEDVFMLPISSVLDFETMSEIVKSGYSRIPVYEGHRGNIITVLFIKDLAFVDPDDNTPLRTLCQYYQNPCNFVFEDVTLDVMFRQFKDGHKGHMAFVHRINNEGEGDPFYETIGLVTLEDVIEEMIQAEIVDETDVFMDNRTKRRRNRPANKLQDFTAFAERHENQRIHISPQLTLATFQFLSTSVDAFRPDTVSETVLRRLLKQDVIQYIKLKGKTKKDPSTFVYHQGKPVDYFVLILEGRVEVTVGRENLVFEAGPFTYFGVQALTQNVGVAESPTPSAMGSLQNINMDSMLRHTFVPDYSVRAITELHYLTVKRSLYLAAKRATLMEKGALSKGATNEQFDTEVDKLLQSVDEDISISGEHKTPSRQVSPNPAAMSSPVARASLTSRASPPPRHENAFNGSRDEHEKLLKSP
ncbi:unextended protein-like [Pectinophora gossypiella]|uniref:unextended protein-like n=1 Tax=Pectinophora gossypiella TaxID=13191 RepID=UPI00214ECEEA|nr:unextended protein-like [Pectinophora gossypiella]